MDTHPGLERVHIQNRAVLTALGVYLVGCSDILLGLVCRVGGEGYRLGSSFSSEVAMFWSPEVRLWVRGSPNCLMTEFETGTQ